MTDISLTLLLLYLYFIGIHPVVLSPSNINTNDYKIPYKNIKSVKWTIEQSEKQPYGT